MTDTQSFGHDIARKARAVSSFARDIKQAISLRESFFQRRIDTQFEQGGGTIFWAIDPSIINAYFRNLSASSRDPWAEYRMFAEPIDAPDQSRDYPSQLFDILVGLLIDRKAAEGSRAQRPLLLLPGHTNEAKTAYDKVVRGFEAATGSARPQQRLREFLDALEAAPADERVSLAEAYQAELHEILYGLHDAHQKFRTFSAALAERRLVTIKGARFDPSFAHLRKYDSVLSAIAEGTHKTIRDNSPGSEQWWQDKLKPMRRLYAESDKVALARLYELNIFLARHKIRVILVTDTPLIIESGQLLVPVKYEAGGLSRDTFTDLYVRHPKAFLSERQVLLPGGEEDSLASMTAWLDAFLAKIDSRRPDLAAFRDRSARFNDDRKLESIARHALEKIPTIHSSLSTDWAKHVGNVLLAHVSTTKEAIARFANQLKLEERDRTEILSEFEAHVSELTDASWSEFFLTAAKSGYELIGIAGDRSAGRMRNIPVLYLRGLPDGEKLLKLIYSRDGVVEHEVEIRESLDRLNTSTDPAEFYVAALCVCLLFGYADRWVIAHALANRAASIGNREMEALKAAKADDIPDDGIVTGREANYLACVTGRLTAKSIADLDRCERFLSKSVSALKFENDLLSKRDTAYSAYDKITGLRTNAEKVAIETARATFQVQAARWAQTGDVVFHALLRDNLATAWRAIAEAAACKANDVRTSTLINLRLNLFSNWFLLEVECALEAQDTIEAAETAQNQIDDILGARACDWLPQISPIDAYAILYAASFDKDFYNRLKAEQPWAERLSASEKTREPSLLMPYDREKCRRMIELAERRVEAAQVATVRG